MILHDLDVLVREQANGNLYDLTDKTYTSYNTDFYTHTVGIDEEMRIDLISFRLFGSVEYSDFLLNLNQIINPLNIRLGDVLIYPLTSQIKYFRKTPETKEPLNTDFLNTQRANIKDKTRLDFVENNYQLPPSMLPNRQSPISIQGNTIVIEQIR